MQITGINPGTWLCVKCRRRFTYFAPQLATSKGDICGDCVPEVEAEHKKMKPGTWRCPVCGRIRRLHGKPEVVENVRIDPGRVCGVCLVDGG